MHRLLLRMMMIGALALAVASGWMALMPDANAITISNLDKVEHQLIFTPMPGRQITRSIAPGATLRALQYTGHVSVSGQKHLIPIKSNDRLVIWSGGNLQVQMHRHQRGEVF